MKKVKKVMEEKLEVGEILKSVNRNKKIEDNKMKKIRNKNK